MNMFNGIFEGDYKHQQKYQLSLTGERNVLMINEKLIVPKAAG